MFQSAASSSRNRKRPGLKLSARSLGAMLGVWVSLYAFADLLLRPRVSTAPLNALLNDGRPSPILTAAYGAIVAAGLLPTVLGVLVLGADFRRSKYFLFAILFTAISIPLSLLSAQDPGLFSYVLTTDYVFLCCILMLSMNVDGAALLQSFLASVAILMSCAMIGVLIDHDFLWGRLIGRTAPNYWGGLGAVTILSSFAIRRLFVRIPMIVLGVFVLYNTQSRSVIVALFASLAVMGIFYLHKPGRKRWLAPICGAIALSLVAAASQYRFIADHVLLLSDPLRGLGSGLTGRSETWREGWELAMAHPWLGVGYNQIAQYLSQGIAIHDAYLSILAETGIIGLMGYLALFLGGLLRASHQAWVNPSDANSVQAGILTSFLVSGALEPGGLHVGNTQTMLPIVLAALAWRWAPTVAAGRLSRLRGMAAARRPALAVSEASRISSPPAGVPGV